MVGFSLGCLFGISYLRCGFCVVWSWHPQRNTERWCFGIFYLLYSVTYPYYHLCYYFLPANPLVQGIEFCANKVEKY